MAAHFLLMLSSLVLHACVLAPQQRIAAAAAAASSTPAGFARQQLPVTDAEWGSLLAAAPARAEGGMSGNLADDKRSMRALVEPYGYTLEHYTVQTADGYLLGMYHIPATPGNGSVSSTARPAVLLQHGLLESSAVWVDNGPGVSLAFCLADAGFSVWMGNRDFTWDEMAAGDLPALLGHVLAATGLAKIGYVGHSQGTTIALAAFSQNPAVAARVSVAALLAPVAFLQHLRSPPIRALAAMDTESVFSALGVRQLLPGDPASAALFSAVCAAQPARCVDILDMICGANPDNLNATRLPLYLQYTPAGTSVKNIAHWAQGLRAAAPSFRKFDYGGWCWDAWLQPQACNWRVYRRLTPPEYPLHRVTVPLALFSGGRDKMAQPEDVAALISALPTRTVILHHHEAEWQHLDFTWGLDAHERVYPKILYLMRRAAAAASAES